MSAPSKYQPAIPGQFVRVTVIVASTIALGIAAYLLYTSLVASGQPLGCGAESGCSEVLTSRWSVVFGIPVSLPAALVYCGMICAMIVFPTVGEPRRNSLWFATLTLAVLLLFAAAWFIGLQVYYLKAICPWCVTEHVLGAIISILVVTSWLMLRKKFPERGTESASPSLALPFFTAIVLFGGLVAAQSFGEFSGPEAARGDKNETDLDSGTGDARTISLLGGKMQVIPAERPMVGSLDSKHIIVVMFDYCCPHCRQTHDYLLRSMQEFPDQIGLVMLPVPLNHDCNKHWEKTEPRFTDSCKLAKLALAVWKVDPDQFEVFDKWLFESKKPRAIDDALAKAKQLVDESALARQLESKKWANDMINENVEFYVATKKERLPVLMSRRFRAVVGRPANLDELLKIFESELGLKQQ